MDRKGIVSRYLDCSVHRDETIIESNTVYTQKNPKEVQESIVPLRLWNMFKNRDYNTCSLHHFSGDNPLIWDLIYRSTVPNFFERVNLSKTIST